MARGNKYGKYGKYCESYESHESCESRESCESHESCEEESCCYGNKGCYPYPYPYPNGGCYPYPNSGCYPYPNVGCYPYICNYKLKPCKSYVPQQGCLACQLPYKPIFCANKVYDNPQLYSLLFNLETNRNETNYNALKAYGDTASSQTGLRVLIALPDGTVAYDSSKGDANTYANFLAKAINENHNTRPEIMMAQISLDGIGVAQRYSSTDNQLQTYVATRVTLKKRFYTNNVGTIRFSTKQN